MTETQIMAANICKNYAFMFHFTGKFAASSFILLTEIELQEEYL
jgi:hypothetical protein